jgi:hypothetical protein
MTEIRISEARPKLLNKKNYKKTKTCKIDTKKESKRWLGLLKNHKKPTRSSYLLTLGTDIAEEEKGSEEQWKKKEGSN